MAPLATLPTGAYAERVDRAEGRVERLAASALRRLHGWPPARRRTWARLVEAVGREGRALDRLDDTALAAQATDLRVGLRARGFADDLVARTFALVREAAGRTLGFRHHDVQLIGGSILLHGAVAEMDTGEGKTLTATLPVCAAALAGLPVHVVTVNDYLAARDAEQMGPIYRALGLRVGLVVHGMTPDARRAAYGADVTYCTNKELTFDYLKDRLVVGGRMTRAQLQVERLTGADARLSRLVLRGLFFALVDEADSVLVDEARTPLIISGGGGGAPQRRLYETALALADQLAAGRDFATAGAEAIGLTDAGRTRLDALARPLGGLWTGVRRREELVTQALVARHVMLRDKHYLVRDDKVQIIDEYTGRLSEDRKWEQGLHQLIEVKEGVALTAPNEPLARMSYQRFFRKYHHLAGMTGTAREVRGELWSVYRLRVVRVPTNRPVQRRALPDRVYATAAEKWDAIVARVAAVHATGQPVLVGTRSVAASDQISAHLTAAGLAHEVLNARQDQAEAEIVAQAGQPGRITVATNMAGRGTDIRLTPDVLALGGLHVIATERHDAGRIDRQLFGRCGRQGDPGSYEMIVSLEDDLVAKHAPRVWRWLLAAAGAGPPARLAARVVRRAQRRAERLHSRMRRELLRYDDQLESTLAFSGRTE